MILPRPSWTNSVSSATIFFSPLLRSSGFRRRLRDHTGVSTSTFIAVSTCVHACSRSLCRSLSFRKARESVAAFGVGYIHQELHLLFLFLCDAVPHVEILPEVVRQ